MKNRNTIFAAILFVFALLCAAAAPKAFGVNPPPDGDYGNGNTAEGALALFQLTTGTANTAIGSTALAHDTIGDNNTATGSQALFSNTTGSRNTAVGLNALFGNTNGTDNTALGFNALSLNGFDAINNTAIGSGALSAGSSGSFNTAIGFNALQNNTASDNTAVGDSALLNNTNGTENTATGVVALFKNTTGSNNTAVGLAALLNNTTGSNNTADGLNALINNNTGSNNIALGVSAGSNLTTGSNNIDIGALGGAAGEANKIRIGRQGTQNGTFIAGIFGVAVTGSQVVVNSTGKLGVAASSARFKEAIKPMDKTSEAILALNPVTFRYKKELDPEGIPQFGLVAEQVEKVNPALVARDEQGKPYTVRYEAVNAMLLNEFLKEHKKVEQQEATITQLRKDMATVVAHAKQQDAQIQKVSARIEMSKPTPRMAVRNP